MQNPLATQAYIELEDLSQKLLLDRDLITGGSGSDCNIALNDPGISRRHAIFRKVGHFWSVQDLGSTNGTWVNGESINRPTRLKVGDRIAFGQMRFVFRIHVEASRSMLDRIVELAPYDFEKLVGALFEKLNFETLVTRQTADGGVDVVAVNRGVIFRGRYLIQCKRYNPANKVSRPEVQAFHGRIAVEPRARGIFITTSSFTRGAQKFSELTGINLIHGQELEELVVRHRLVISGP
jgi:hypothetical protein